MFLVTVQGVLNYNNEPIGPAGVVYGGQIETGDELYIIGPKDKLIKAKVEEILKPKVDEEGKQLNPPQFDSFNAANPGELAIFRIEKEAAAKVGAGDVLSNAKPTDLNNMAAGIVNPRLKGLLLERNTNRIQNIFGLVAEEIAMSAKFLVVATFDKQIENNGLGYAKLEEDTKISLTALRDPEGRFFIPAFTDPSEVAKWEGRPADSTVVYTFDKIAEMMNDENAPTGIVINPFTDNLLLDKELILKFMEKRKEDLKERKLDEIIAKNRTE